MPKKSNTRAAQGSGTIRKRPDGRWEARITLGGDPGTGRPRRKSIYGKTQKEVREKMQAAAVAVNEGDYFEPAKITLGQWLDTWITDFQGDKAWSTTRTYRANIENHIKPALGAVKLGELAPHQIQRFYNTMLKRGKQAIKRGADGKPVRKDGKLVRESAPLNAKTVRNVHGTLIKALNVAVDMGYIRTNPAGRLTLPRTERMSVKPLTNEQVAAYLKAAKSDSLSVILQVIVLTGMRESEALGLTWDCIDFKAGTITVKQQLQKRPLDEGGAQLVPPKNGKSRTVTVAPSVVALLEQARREQATQRLRAGEVWQGWQSEKERRTALVFTTDDGRPISHTSLRYHFKQVAAEADAAERRVHDLRHTYATVSLENGDDFKTVQENLGHASAAFTLDVYGHVSDKMRAESAARWEDYIQAATR